jgi:hypothetical protein
VAQVLGLLEEKGKNKEWLLETLKHLRVKLDVSPTVNSYEILRHCPTAAIKHIQKMLYSDYLEIEEISGNTKTLHWFFTDIVGSSTPKLSTKSQIRKITVLQSHIRNTEAFKRSMTNSVVLPTGDGVAIGFSDSPETPLQLAIQLSESLEKYNKTKTTNDRIQIRVGIETGPVYFIKDVIGNDTVWGPGIILSRRLMDLCAPNQIITSRKIGDDISKLSAEYKAILHPIGVYEIKHGEQLLVYNVYGKGFGNKIAPKKGKVNEKPENDFDNPVKFEFDQVEIRLDVIDAKTMIVHHTWVWDVKNTTKNPLSEIFYEIVGDVPKDFADLNISIKDGKNRKLGIISVDVNKPYAKKFHVKMKSPIKKNQKARLVLEYDWEEPERVFEYVLSTKSRKFRYVFTVPKTVPIKNMILEVIPGLGMKRRVDPPPKITYSKDKTNIVWETKDVEQIKRLSAYEFRW